jgi:excisionase family DNA binding protein
MILAMTDTLTRSPDASSDDPTRPPGHLSYAEAVEATGVSRRHLRRLVAAGKLEAADHGGRRWVTTSSLLAAGLTLTAPKPQANGTGQGGQGGDETPGHAGGSATDAELESLRRQLAVVQAVADERGRELERVHALAMHLIALQPGGRTGDQTPGPGEGTVPGAKRRRWLRAR